MRDLLKADGVYLESLFSGGWYSQLQAAIGTFLCAATTCLSAVLEREMHLASAAAAGFGITTALFVAAALFARGRGIWIGRGCWVLSLIGFLGLIVLSAACSGASERRSAQPEPVSRGTAAEEAETTVSESREQTPQPEQRPAEMPFTDSDHREPSFCLQVAVNESGTGAKLSMYVTSWRNVGSRPQPGQRRVETEAIKSGTVTFDAVTRFVEYSTARLAVRQLASGRVRVEWKYTPFYEWGLLPVNHAGKRFTKCVDKSSAKSYQAFYESTPARTADRERQRAADQRSAERARVATCNSLWRQMERATRASEEQRLYRQWRALDCTTNTLD